MGYTIEFTIGFGDNITSKYTKSTGGLDFSVKEKTKRTDIGGEIELRRHVTIDIWTDRISLWQKIKNKLKKK